MHTNLTRVISSVECVSMSAIDSAEVGTCLDLDQCRLFGFLQVDGSVCGPGAVYFLLVA